MREKYTLTNVLEIDFPCGARIDRGSPRLQPYPRRHVVYGLLDFPSITHNFFRTCFPHLDANGETLISRLAVESRPKHEKNIIIV